MADPWTHDLNSLGDRSRIGLRTLDATRAAITDKRSTQENPMRLFKQRPALAALIVLAIVVMFAPVAYAIVDRLVLSVDVDKPAEEIESDLESQLEQAGIPATVKAEKHEDGVEISIESDDPSVGSNLDVVVPNLPDNAVAQQLRIEVSCTLTDAQEAKLTQALRSPAFRGALGGPDADMAAAVRKALADAGFHDVDVAVHPNSVAITVKSPPK